MKCPECGFMNSNNAVFCQECGANMRSEKECPNCHSPVKPAAKFCSICGYSLEAGAKLSRAAGAGASFGSRNMVAGDVKLSGTQNGGGRGSAGASLGDKNMIAGDVSQVAIGRQENVHLGAGATYVKNEDETKTVVKCHICGRINTIANFFECPKCHEMTCEKHYDGDLKLCAQCKEKGYQTAFRNARENGRMILSPEQSRKLEREYRIDADRLAELQRDVIRGESCHLHADDEFENIDYALFDQGNIYAAYDLLHPMEEDERYKYNSMVLSRLLSAALKIASREKENDLLRALKKMQKDPSSAQTKQSLKYDISAEQAAETATRIVDRVFEPGNDTLGIYLILIDQMLEKQPFPERVWSTLRRVFDVKADTGMSAFADRLLKRAEEFWPDSILLKCRRILYSLMQFEEKRLANYRKDAESCLKSLPRDGSVDSLSKMERSWIARVCRATLGESFDPTPQYCDDHDLFFFVLNPWSGESFCKMADTRDLAAEPNRKEYFRLVTIAATSFPSPSSFVLGKLGDCYADGIGTRKDVPAALLCYQYAAAAEGIEFKVDGTVFLSYRDNGSRPEFAVPNGITEIANGAFADCGLKKVSIPSSVRTICAGAFRNCRALQTVELAEGLKDIRSKAFEGCASLKSITIPMSVSRLEEEFSPSCAVLFAGDKPVRAAAFPFDGLIFSIPAATGIRAVVCSFAKKVQSVEDKAAWCHSAIISKCDRDCKTCLLSSEKGAPAQKIMAFLTFCRDNGVRLPEPPGYVDGLFTLAEDHMLGKGGLDQAPGKAAAWYRELVERGHAGYGDCLKRIRELFEKSRSKEGKNAAVRILEDLFSDSRRCSALATEDWLFLLRALPASFSGIRFCPWDSFTPENWVDLLIADPDYAEYCGLTADSDKTYWEKIDLPQWTRLADGQRCFQPFRDLRKGVNLVQHLKKELKWERFCNWAAASRSEWLALLKDRELLQRLLVQKPELLKLCPWDGFAENEWLELFAVEPEYVHFCKDDVFRNGISRSTWLDLLKDRGLFQRLCVQKPELLKLCPWDDFAWNEWIDLFSVEPEYMRFCGENVFRCRITKSTWLDLLKDRGLLPRLCVQKPELLKFCPWDSFTWNEWLKLFAVEPEYMRFCGENVFRDSLSVSDWIDLLKNDSLFQSLLSQRPNLLKTCPWNSFKGKDWVELLLSRPEYGSCCKWSSLSDADLLRLKEKASDRLRVSAGDMEKLPLRIVVGMGWEEYRDWSRITTGKQWCEILLEYPELSKSCQCWDRFTTADWVDLLTKQPGLYSKCDCWMEFDPKEWDKLLKAQKDIDVFFPVYDPRHILNYTDYRKHNAIFATMSRYFAFWSASAFLLVFTVISLWGPTGWFRLFAESWIHALISGAVWIVAAVFCARCYAVWGPFHKTRWMNLVYAGIFSFSFYTFYHWSFLFSRWSFALIVCGILSSLSWFFLVFAFDGNKESCGFFATFSPFFIAFSWFLLSPVHWSVWQIVAVCSFFLILFFMSVVFAESGGFWDENPIASFILSMLFPLIISVWFLLSPVSSQACYKIANELQSSFKSASQVFYRKGQSADPDFVQLKDAIPQVQYEEDD